MRNHTGQVAARMPHPREATGHPQRLASRSGDGPAPSKRPASSSSRRMAEGRGCGCGGSCSGKSKGYVERYNLRSGPCRAVSGTCSGKSWKHLTDRRTLFVFDRSAPGWPETTHQRVLLPRGGSSTIGNVFMIPKRAFDLRASMAFLHQESSRDGFTNLISTHTFPVI
jgi:hypothetical protein